MKSRPLPEKMETSLKDLATIRSVLPYLWPEEVSLRLRVIIALAFLILAKIANVIVPIFFKEAVDALNPSTTEIIVLPIMLLLGYGLVRILAQAFGELRDAVFTRVAQRAVRLVGIKTFRHLHSLSVQFHLDRKTGGVSRAIERGAKGIEFLLRFMVFNVVPTLLEILLICGILWKLYGFLFAFVTFVTLLAYIVWTLIVTEWRLKFRREMNKMDNEANTAAIDSLLNFETVKYFCNENYEVDRFNYSLKNYEEAAVKSSASLAFLNIGQAVIITVGLTLVMVLAGHEIVHNNMTLGDFVLVNTYMIQLYLPLNFLGFVYREIKRSIVDMENMFSLLNERDDLKQKADAPSLAIKKGKVKFERVSFNYSLDRPILRDISFEVEPGKKIAIVGPSGSGKSTIARLLLRFYDVSNGKILIDGYDIRGVTMESVRAAVGIVPQDTVLFNQTISYNIAYGWPGASEEQIVQAAKIAQIDNFITGLPKRYETLVGERGLKLSGGEKQRVAIARTILKNPQILVLDEATSALDSKTEQEILRALEEISKERTTLTIAHRLSTVINSDEILVLDRGLIVENGTHLSLLANDGTYASMWKTQQKVASAREILERTDHFSIKLRNDS